MPVTTETTTMPSVSVVSEPIMFSRNFRAFKRIFRAAREAWKRDGTNPMDAYYSTTGPILGEEASPAGHMFGVELEFKRGDGSPSANTVKQNIADRLQAAGLGNGVVYDYHCGPRNNKWIVEYDASVDGEIISPKLRDTTNSWTALDTVIKAMLEENCEAWRTSVGGHISVDATALGNDAESWARLFKIATKFEDVMYRLATNPYRAKKIGELEGRRRVLATHRRRASGYAEPINMRGYTPAVPRYNMHRGTWLATESGNANGGRVEFRIFDGTLNAPIIQAQVKLASAILRAAVNADHDALLDSIVERPVGWHRQQPWRRNEDGTQVRQLSTRLAWKRDSRALRQLVDIIFTSTTDKEQIISLYAMSDWSFSRRNRRTR